MGLEERIGNLEKSLGLSGVDKEIVQFNNLIEAGLYLIEIGVLKSATSIEALRALMKPYPKDYKQDDTLTPENEKEFRLFAAGVLNGTGEPKSLWIKYGGGKEYPFEKTGKEPEAIK